MTTIIHKEHVEAYLFSLPRSRTFQFYNTHGCFLSCLGKEFYGHPWVSAGGTDFMWMDGYSYMANELLGWWCECLNSRYHSRNEGLLVVGTMQDLWRKHFPEPEVVIPPYRQRTMRAAVKAGLLAFLTILLLFTGCRLAAAPYLSMGACRQDGSFIGTHPVQPGQIITIHAAIVSIPLWEFDSPLPPGGTITVLGQNVTPVDGLPPLAFHGYTWARPSTYTVPCGQPYILIPGQYHNGYMAARNNLYLRVGP